MSAVANGETHRRSRRLKLRATPEECDLIGRGHGRGPAGTRSRSSMRSKRPGGCAPDRTVFDLDVDGLAEWEAVNRRRPRDLPGLGRLIKTYLSFRRLNRRYEAPVPLGGGAPARSVECRSAEQTSWLRRFGRQSVAMGTTRVFVVTEPGDRARGGLLRVVHGASRNRGGAASGSQGCRQVSPAGRPAGPPRGGCPPRRARSGRGPLQDVFARLLGLSDRIGCRGLLVHAETPQARECYLHLVPEFEPSPTNDLHLLLLVKDIRRTLAGT